MTDPVCGMKVDPSSAAGTHEHKGVKYFFCSTHCLAQFKADPEKYLAKTAPARFTPRQRAPSTPARCTPRSCKDGPGSCPKCGMALVPMVPAAPVAAEYTCPMHPEVRSPKPGNCPKCGMALVPVAGAQEDDSELRDMTRRFWVGAVLSAPLVVIAMAPYFGWLQPFGLAPHCAHVPRIRARNAGRAVERLAVLPQVLALAQEPQSEHVHPDRARASRLAYLFSVVGGDSRPACSRRNSASHGGEVGIYFEAAAVIVDPGAARRSHAVARHRGNQPGDPQAACARAQHGAAHRARWARGRGAARPRCRSATSCACAPARKCRWTGPASRARPTWTSP